MEEFIVGIPSYKRAKSQGTLAYMNGMGVPKDRIFIFVQTKDDETAYTENYGDKANIIYAPANGVAQARNNILNYFGGKENILMLDDDIAHIGRLREQLDPINTREEFCETINRCFKEAKARRALLFGVYPVYNDFYMSRTITERTTVNTLLGIPSGFSLRFDDTYRAKEDIELCGRILSNGGNILRYDFLAVEAKHRTNDGGCKEIWASEMHQNTVKRLCHKYPTIFAPQKNKPQEVRLKFKSKKTKLK